MLRSASSRWVAGIALVLLLAIGGVCLQILTMRPVRWAAGGSMQVGIRTIPWTEERKEPFFAWLATQEFSERVHARLSSIPELTSDPRPEIRWFAPENRPTLDPTVVELPLLARHRLDVPSFEWVIDERSVPGPNSGRADVDPLLREIASAVREVCDASIEAYRRVEAADRERVVAIERAARAVRRASDDAWRVRRTWFDRLGEPWEERVERLRTIERFLADTLEELRADPRPRAPRLLIAPAGRGRWPGASGNSRLYAAGETSPVPRVFLQPFPDHKYSPLEAEGGPFDLSAVEDSIPTELVRRKGRILSVVEQEEKILVSIREGLGAPHDEGESTSFDRPADPAEVCTWVERQLSLLPDVAAGDPPLPEELTARQRVIRAFDERKVYDSFLPGVSVDIAVEVDRVTYSIDETRVVIDVEPLDTLVERTLEARSTLDAAPRARRRLELLAERNRIEEVHLPWGARIEIDPTVSNDDLATLLPRLEEALESRADVPDDTQLHTIRVHAHGRTIPGATGQKITRFAGLGSKIVSIPAQAPTEVIAAALAE